MSHRIAVFSVLVVIAIVSFSGGQVKPTASSQAASDVKNSDHDRIEKLLVEVAELQEKLAALRREYDTHTHQLHNLEVARLPSSIECDQSVVQWAPASTNRQSIDRVCRQLRSGDISVLVSGKESIVTAPPRP